MQKIEIANGRAVLYGADCREVLWDLEDNSIDAAVMDPPYALVSVGKRFGKEGAAPAKFGTDGLYARASAGFMGEDWDTGETVFAVEFWREVYRVLKPGAFLLAFGGTRTYHRLACAIEDAGFDVRDMLSWLYGSGFPKNHDLALNLDKANGHTAAEQRANGGPITEEAEAWEGWGTALKPGQEPICMARKPFKGSLVANIREWGVGALNINASKIGEAARWPANVLHDGSEEVLDAFPDASGQRGKTSTAAGSKTSVVYDTMAREGEAKEPRGDSGSAARFFYCAKAQKQDRDEGLEEFEAVDVTGGGGTAHEKADAYGSVKANRKNVHPTVKPTPLMRYLVRLVTPPGGVVLDPFAGSGSTGKAALLENMRFIGIERADKYIPIAEARIKWAAEKADWDTFLGE